MTTGSVMSQSELQNTFIAMIFAFVVTFVAQEIAEFLIVLTNNWQFVSSLPNSTERDDGEIVELFPIATHMFLALLMISISWIMWSKSKAAGHIVNIDKIFSLQFIKFILEVLLVTLYYSLAKSVEVDFSAYERVGTIAKYITDISAKPEAFQMLLIFLMFLIWDFIADVFNSPMITLPTTKWEAFCCYLSGMAVYCSVSIFCAVASFFVFMSLPVKESPLIACAGDIALISVLLFFYHAKGLEFYLLKIFVKQDERNNTKRDAPLTRKEWQTLVLLMLIYFLSLEIIALHVS